MCFTTYQKADSDLVIQLYIPEHLRKDVIEKYHDNNGHIGIYMTRNLIKTKYYWPIIYKTYTNK